EDADRLGQAGDEVVADPAGRGVARPGRGPQLRRGAPPPPGQPPAGGAELEAAGLPARARPYGRVGDVVADLAGHAAAAAAEQPVEDQAGRQAGAYVEDGPVVTTTVSAQPLCGTPCCGVDVVLHHDRGAPQPGSQCRGQVERGAVQPE